MKLIATRPFSYRGRPLRTGDAFDVTDRSLITIFTAGRYPQARVVVEDGDSPQPYFRRPVPPPPPVLAEPLPVAEPASPEIRHPNYEPEPEPVHEEEAEPTSAAEDDRTPVVRAAVISSLKTRAQALGIELDGRWERAKDGGEQRLRDEIAKVLARYSRRDMRPEE